MDLTDYPVNRLMNVAMAGVKDIHTGKIEDIMLVKTAADIERFKKIYGIEGSIDKEY